MESDLAAIERAIWETERDRQRKTDVVQMHPFTEMRLLSSGEWVWPDPEPLNRTLFGMPVLLDPSMSPGEIKLVADCGCVIKLTNLG